MLEDQVGAAAYAGQLLDPRLSPRAFATGPATGRTTGWLGAEDALRQLGLRPSAEVRAPDLVTVLGGRHTATGVRVLPEPAVYDLVFMNTAFAGTGHAFELEGVPRDLLEDEAFWRNTGCAIAGGGEDG
jgi:hypothetical protein